MLLRPRSEVLGRLRQPLRDCRRSLEEGRDEHQHEYEQTEEHEAQQQAGRGASAPVPLPMHVRHRRLHREGKEQRQQQVEDNLMQEPQHGDGYDHAGHEHDRPDDRGTNPRGRRRRLERADRSDRNAVGSSSDLQGRRFRLSVMRRFAGQFADTAPDVRRRFRFTFAMGLEPSPRDAGADDGSDREQERARPIAIVGLCSLVSAHTR